MNSVHVEEEVEIDPRIGGRHAGLAMVRVRERVPERVLFSDSLLESESRDKQRRTWSTVCSFVLQLLVVGVVVIIPLMYTEVLPKQQLIAYLIAPPPPPPPPAPAAAEQVAKTIQRVQSDIENGQLRTPAAIPKQVKMIREDVAPPQINTTGGVIGGVPGGIPGGQLGGVIGGIVSSTSNLAILPKPKLVMPTRVRISQGVSAGLLIQKVEPPYPPLAQAARIQGRVVLSAIIAKDGSIQNLEVVGGHPMLVPTAIDAVKQWRYKPYLLNGEPVEVETQITVTFTLRD
jgi:periplasmic protein TonB